MRLIEACEPLFQYVSNLVRALSKGANPKPEAVKKTIKEILAGVRSSCAHSQTLTRLFDEVELPLIFFVDFMIAESKSRFAKSWEPIAFERQELAGDDKFFKILDNVLGETTSDAAEKLEVFHVCLGLGFMGLYAVEGPASEGLKKMKKQVAERVGDRSDPSGTKFSPAAYEGVDTSDLIEGKNRRFWTLLILLVGMIAVLIVVNYFQFKWESESLSVSMQTVLERASQPAKAGPGGDKG